MRGRSLSHDIIGTGPGVTSESLLLFSLSPSVVSAAVFPDPWSWSGCRVRIPCPVSVSGPPSLIVAYPPAGVPASGAAGASSCTPSSAP